MLFFRKQTGFPHLWSLTRTRCSHPETCFTWDNFISYKNLRQNQSSGLYLFSETNCNDFSRIFHDSDLFFHGSKFHLIPKISKSILLVLMRLILKTFRINILRRFQDCPGPILFFQDLSVPEIVKIKFQDFSGFQGPV